MTIDQGLRAVVVLLAWTVLLFAFAESTPIARRSWYRRAKCAVRPGHHRGFVARQTRLVDLHRESPIILIPAGSAISRRTSIANGDVLIVFSPGRCPDCGESET